MDLVPMERELLTAAEQNARRALSKSRAAAEVILRNAHEEAVELLVRNQEAAAELLIQQAGAASSYASNAGLTTSGLSDGSVEAFEKHAQWQSDQLLEAQARAAEMLLQAQRVAADKLSRSVERAAADALLAGQREAAAILLEARLRIEADRAARTRVPPP